MYVASSLRRAGHSVQLLDADPARRPDLGALIAAHRPDWVGLSFMTMCWDRAAALAADLRVRLPGVPLVGGGPHPTAAPEQTLAGVGLDAVVVGEGEQTAVELADALARGEAPHTVPGVVTTHGRGPARAFAEDLDALPFPARDLLGHERYLRPPGLIRGYASSRVASVLAGRGCAFKCSFCESHRQLGTAVRMRSVGNMLSEIDQLVDEDRVRGLYWVDDVFTHHRAWVLELCAALVKRPYRLRWACQARVTAVDGPLLRAMKQAGCVQVDFGVESGSARILRAMHKGIAPRDVIEAFDLAHATGLRTGASFILGSPGETEEDIAETAALAARIRSDWTVFFFSTPYPGTELGDREGPWRESWPSWGERWNNRVGPTPIPQGGPPADRVVAARRALQNQHFRRNYLHLQNLPFILRLAGTLREGQVRRAILGCARRSGRLDDVVEAAFSAWRAP